MLLIQELKPTLNDTVSEIKEIFDPEKLTLSTNSEHKSA